MPTASFAEGLDTHSKKCYEYDMQSHQIVFKRHSYIYIYMIVCVCVCVCVCLCVCHSMYVSDYIHTSISTLAQIGWGCKIHRLDLCIGVRPPRNKCLRYDTKHSDSEVPVMLELWGLWSTPSLPSLQSPRWPRMVAPDRALFMA